MCPYIPQYRRKSFDRLVSEIASHVGEMGRLGEVNYIITKLLLKTFNHNYTEFAQALGVLESVKLELYRRVIAPYEDRKKEGNGDVY